MLEDITKNKKALISAILLILVIMIIILYKLAPWKKQAEAIVEQPPLFTSNEEQTPITLYFGSEEEDKEFVTESREIYKTQSLVNNVKQAILKLIEGPNSDEASPVIPKGTKLREIYIENGHAYVNFSKEISENHPGGSEGEMATVSGITNTLLKNFSEIHDVQILIEGKVEESIAGHVDISKPFKNKESEKERE
ncbi:GerMN domain-containing protein [Candidatus Poribacteria bacterium]|nr:GerMN domain-containing protein [Candidatus Poribacteria bacterium]